ncbi:SIR2 family NAD-dependent protein deacylase [Oceanidesulfovibrio marinus]|uniref:NAD-dependent protein deacylase n=1 Tax=Oceanidesulfovibrio marinus TaxID=370038 RepID=A0ABX6NC23_9BACT|nr:NAD-dependent deacylase [Oceanidesulfovibrio marinus]QJT08146.1 NAD-dependent deacylase [Oceanidesulfovibrio marinus]
MDRDLRDAAAAISSAQRIGVLAGAGISAESGIPTFRGASGLWKGMDPVKLATPRAFENDPASVWEFYAWRRQLIAKARPNPAHHALALLEKVRPGTTVMTQNVDGLHALAGSRNVVEIHGSIWQVRCESCGTTFENRDPELGADPNIAPPQCACGGPLRPGVVWFGEHLDPDAWSKAFEAAVSAEVFIIVGTSGLVQPAASLADAAAASGATLIEVNLEPTPLSPHVDIMLLGASGDILPRLVPAM